MGAWAAIFKVVGKAASKAGQAVAKAGKAVGKAAQKFGKSLKKIKKGQYNKGSEYNEEYKRTNWEGGQQAMGGMIQILKMFKSFMLLFEPFMKLWQILDAAILQEFNEEIADFYEAVAGEEMQQATKDFVKWLRNLIEWAYMPQDVLIGAIDATEGNIYTSLPWGGWGYNNPALGGGGGGGDMGGDIIDTLKNTIGW